MFFLRLTVFIPEEVNQGKMRIVIVLAHTTIITASNIQTVTHITSEIDMF